MDALYCYRYFHSVQLHFKQKSYDVRKYGLNTKRFSVENFSKDNGGSFFHSLATEYNSSESPEEIKKQKYHRLVYSNLFINPTIWVDQLSSKEAWDNYLWTKKYQDSMQMYFFQDVKYLRECYGKISSADIFQEIMNKNIHPETISILSKFKPNLRDDLLKIYGNIIYENVCDRLKKYDAFVSIPSVEYLNQIKEKLKNIVNNS